MPDDPQKTPIDTLLELGLYAPLGLALAARDSLPDLIARGRQQVTSQVALAKMMGQYAVKEGEKDLRKRVEDVSQTLSSLGILPEPNPTPGTPMRPRPAAARSRRRPRRRPRCRPMARRRPTARRRRRRRPTARHRRRSRADGTPEAKAKAQPARRRCEPGRPRHPRLRHAVGVAGGAAAGRAVGRRARGGPRLRVGHPGPHARSCRRSRQLQTGSSTSGGGAPARRRRRVARARRARRPRPWPSWRRRVAARCSCAREGRAEPVAETLAADVADPRPCVLVGTIDDISSGYAVGRTESLRDGVDAGRRSATSTSSEGARAVGVGEAMMGKLLEWFRGAGCAGVDATALPGQPGDEELLRGVGLHRPAARDAPPPDLP